MGKQQIKDRIDRFLEEDNLEYLVDFVREYSEIGDSKTYGGKHAGSDAEKAGAEFIFQRLKSIGLENVEMIPLETSKYQFNDATLRSLADEKITIKPYGYTSPPAGSGGITSSIIDAGLSNRAAYEGIDAQGRIVLLEAMGVLEGASLSCQVMQAEKEGAAAVLVNATEDVLDADTIRVQPLNYIPKIPVVGISTKDAAWIRNVISDDEAHLFNLAVDSDYQPGKGISWSVVGEIKGQIDERIIFSSHLDHYFKCLQDNISSVATLLGIARAMIGSGCKPARTMTFVFNSSHETGMADSRYPYISGSYKLIDGPKKDWLENTIVDFNFEYTALDMGEMRTFGSHEMLSQYEDFYKCLPESLVGGEKAIRDKASSADYYLLAWADSISYISKGIPVIMNDTITEQIYDGTSPYIGRDHSNHDNWDSFSEKDLDLSWKLYGAYAIYVDSLPIAQFDFGARCSHILDDEDLESLDELKIDNEGFRRAVSKMREKGASLYGAIAKYNESNGGSAFSNMINKGLLAINRIIVGAFDKINSQDFITTAHKKYLTNINLLEGAIKSIGSGDVEAALDEYLKKIDLVPLSLNFDHEIAEHARRRINSPEYSHTRLWAGGRELSSLTLFEEANALKDDAIAELESAGKAAAPGIIESLTAARDHETANLIEALGMEIEALETILGSMDAVMEMLGEA